MCAPGNACVYLVMFCETVSNIVLAYSKKTGRCISRMIEAYIEH